MSALLAGACSASTAPMPEVEGSLAFRVSREGSVARRFGSYQIPGTTVYVSGHQGGSEVGMQFGAVGLLAGHHAAQSTGERKVGPITPHLLVDLPALTERLLAEELARRGDTRRFAAPGASSAATLEIRPYVVVNFIGEDRARLWVVLLTTLEHTRHRWRLQYVAGVGEPRPVAGEHGWAAGDGALLREALELNLRATVDLLLRDTSRSLPRGPGRLAMVRAHWLWMKEPRARTALVLDETEATLTVLPCEYEKDADGFSNTGMTILDRRAVTVTRGPETPQPCLGRHVDLN